MDALPALLWLLPWVASAVMTNASKPSFNATATRGWTCGVLAIVFTFVFGARGFDFALSAVFGSIFAMLLAIFWPVRKLAHSPHVLEVHAAKFKYDYEINSSKSSQPQSLSDRLQQASPPTWLRTSEILNKNAARNHPSLARSGGEEWQTSTRPITERIVKTVSARHPGAAEPHLSASTTYSQSKTPNHRSFDPEDWREESFLKRMGYRAGASGLPPSERREILRRAFELPLPPDMPPDYARECGQHNSTVRLQRIVHHIRGRISMAERRQANMSHAIHDWESDIRWMAAQYERHFPRVRFF